MKVSGNIFYLDKVKSKVIPELFSLNTRKEILEIAKATSIELLEEKKPLDEILISCKNISKSLQISDKNHWIEFELNGYLVKYKTRDDLYDNLPNYRKSNWKFFDVYGNIISLSPDIMDLFGKSTVYHSVKELENKSELIIENKFLEKFNKFIAEHGMDYASKSVRIHEAKISKKEIDQILVGIKNRTQEFLDMVISILEVN